MISESVYQNKTWSWVKQTVKLIFFVCVGVMYVGEYDVSVVFILCQSVHPHRASLKVCLTTVGI